MAGKRGPIECSEPPAQPINSSDVRRAHNITDSPRLQPGLQQGSAVMVYRSRAGSATGDIVSSPDPMVVPSDSGEGDNPIKTGIAVVCTSTLEPGRKDYIANCTAGERMTQCLGTELGLDVTKSTPNMSSQELDNLIDQQRNHPKGYNKAVLYIFCHGNAESVMLADKPVMRKYIIEKFRSQFPPEVIKIIIFECCRLEGCQLESPTTSEGVEEKGFDATKSKMVSLWVGEEKSKSNAQYYDVSDNVIVIEATNSNNRAHYDSIRGCGFFTDQFADLAPKENVSLNDLLIKVRSGVLNAVKEHGKYQVVECKDRLFDVVNLLADSRGTARIPATNVCANSSLVKTTITWVIDERVADQVDHCYVMVTPSGEAAKISEPTKSGRIASFSGLRPNADHTAKVVTVYKGGHEVSSKTCYFTTKERVCATHVATSSSLLKTSVSWAIDERIKDQIDHCYVKVSSDGETAESGPTNSRMVTFSGLKPNTDHIASVVTKYNDGELVTSEDYHFRTKDIRKINWTVTILIVFSFFLLLAVFSYAPYLYYSQLDNNGATYFISKNATIECGFGRSNEHKGINLKGMLEKKDTAPDSITTQVIHNDALKLHTQKLHPIIGGYIFSYGIHRSTLIGWNNYLWEGSMISGECCVQNDNDSEATASLYLFRNDDDRVRYIKGGSADNYALMQTITLPPSTSVCFTEWGKNNSYVVTKRGYHFFVVDVSRDEMSYESEIILTQKYVLMSDYENQPHYFDFDNHTYFKFPNDYHHPTEYLAICHSPVTIEALHIQSWNSPILPKLPFVFVLSFGVIGCFVTATILGIILYHTFSVIKHSCKCTKHKNCTNFCKCTGRQEGYEMI